MLTGNVLVKRYVGALFGAAKDNDLIDDVFDSLQNLDKAFQGVPELKGYVLSPEVPAKRKIDMLLTSVGDECPEILKRFFQLVLDKSRTDILPDVFQAYNHFREENLGRVEVHVTTAVPASQKTKSEITQRLSRLTSKTPVVEWHEDPALLGGYRIVIGNKSYDFSLSRQLDIMREQMTK